MSAVAKSEPTCGGCNVEFRAPAKALDFSKPNASVNLYVSLPEAEKMLLAVGEGVRRLKAHQSNSEARLRVVVKLGTRQKRVWFPTVVSRHRGSKP